MSDQQPLGPTNGSLVPVPGTQARAAPPPAAPEPAAEMLVVIREVSAQVKSVAELPSVANLLESLGKHAVVQAELQKAQLEYAHASHMEQLRLSADVERRKFLLANRLVAVCGAVSAVMVVCVAALASLKVVTVQEAALAATTLLAFLGIGAGVRDRHTRTPSPGAPPPVP